MCAGKRLRAGTDMTETALGAPSDVVSLAVSELKTADMASSVNLLPEKKPWNLGLVGELGGDVEPDEVGSERFRVKDDLNMVASAKGR